MRRLAKVIVLLILVGGGLYLLLRPQPTTVAKNVDVWVGNEESGCAYPVGRIMDGKDPEWWSANQRRWNQFNSKEEALAAGYRECAE